MSGMTKEELRNALVSHGVEVPPLASIKKEEFVSLYQEHVAPVDSGDFSSDEESDRSSRRSPRKSASKIELKEINSTDVKALDDDELFLHLKKHGIDVGPIVASTRGFYEKKLALVLSGDTGPVNGDSNEFSANEDDDEEEEQFDKLVLRNRVVTETLSPVENLGQDKEEEIYDTLELRNRSVTETLSKLEDLGQDNDDDEVIIEKRVTRSKVSSNNSSSVTTPPPTGGLRQRMTTVDQVDTAGIPANYDWDLSPSPRPSIHSYKVSNTSKSYLQTEKVTSSATTRKLLTTVESESSEEPLVMKRKGGRMLTLIKLMLVLAAVGLVVYLVVTGQEETGGVVSPDMVEEAVNSAQGNKGEQ